MLFLFGGLFLALRGLFFAFTLLWEQVVVLLDYINKRNGGGGRLERGEEGEWKGERGERGKGESRGGKGGRGEGRRGRRGGERGQLGREGGTEATSTQTYHQK